MRRHGILRQIWFLSLSIVLGPALFLLSCGDEEEEASQDPAIIDSGTDPFAQMPKGTLVISKIYSLETDLPTCEGDLLAKVVYVKETSLWKVCDADGWTEFTLQDSKAASVLSDISCEAGKDTIKYDGTKFTCATDNVAQAVANTDKLEELKGSCTAGQVVQWSGGAWSCVTRVDKDRLSELKASCGAGQIPKKMADGTFACQADDDSLKTLQSSCGGSGFAKYNTATKAWSCVNPVPPDAFQIGSDTDLEVSTSSKNEDDSVGEIIKKGTAAPEAHTDYAVVAGKDGHLFKVIITGNGVPALVLAADVSVGDYYIVIEAKNTIFGLIRTQLFKITVTSS